ncbi:MucBP domain-containing protein, partial [Streptococcus suis]|uniref:MucBP domain-containing protein n=1 Tax=Streptococcus suis TaxID=1307 RepID=UPI001ABE196D|nr:MucBP domain-containing protein [Streptococcus suis]
PKNPGEDTEIPYVKDPDPTPDPVKEGKVTVKYEDTEGNELQDPREDTPLSPVGKEYNTGENTTERPEEITKDGKRYVRVPSLTKGDETGTVTEGETTVTYVYKKVANWIPLIPGEPNPPKNPYPFDPEKPEDPIKTPPTTPDGTPNVPYVPGYTPKDPNGNPLTPVDP